MAQVVVVFVMGMVGVPSPIVMAVVVLIMGVVGELLHIVMAVVPWPRWWWCSSWASWAWLVHHCMSYCRVHNLLQLYSQLQFSVFSKKMYFIMNNTRSNYNTN